MLCCLQLSNCTGAFRQRIQSNPPPLLFREQPISVRWTALFMPLDLATGKQRWRYATSGPVQESSPCVCNGTVYIGDLNGIFHAVDASTGKARWTFKSDAEIKSSPNCFGNRIYFGSYDQNLYCLCGRHRRADLEVHYRRARFIALLQSISSMYIYRGVMKRFAPSMWFQASKSIRCSSAPIQAHPRRCAKVMLMSGLSATRSSDST